MKQRKIAISIAVVAAIATPFASGTYKANPLSKMFVPLSKDEEAEIRAVLAETNNCQNWQAGGRFDNHFPLSKYLALNAIAAVAGACPICSPH
jgi:hypothetical protein